MIPVMCSWDGESFVPQQRFAKLCDKQFVVGQQYPMAPIEARSRASHNHYFAAVEEGWRNLPEQIAEQFPTSEHLRKYALIKAGFNDHRSIVCASKAEAQRIAAFLKPMDEFCIVTINEALVTVYTAQSQSLKAMGKKAFQDSKDAVLDIIASMIGVKSEELSSHSVAA